MAENENKLKFASNRALMFNSKFVTFKAQQKVFYFDQYASRSEIVFCIGASVGRSLRVLINPHQFMSCTAEQLFVAELLADLRSDNKM